MSGLIPFDFNGSQIRAFEQGGEAWFVAKDVADLLEYTNTRKAVRDHCKAATPLGGNESFPLDPQTVVIPERDIYRLVMRSKMQEAEQFEEWVVGTVLPSIRKNGGYISNQENLTDAEIVASGLMAAQNIIEDQKRKLAQKSEKIAQDQPKVKFYDEFCNADGLYGLQNAARALSQPPNKFCSWLKREYIFYQGRTLVPYRKYVTQGLFEVKNKTVDGESRPQAFITPKGLQYFARKLDVEQINIDELISMNGAGQQEMRV